MNCLKLIIILFCLIIQLINIQGEIFEDLLDIDAVIVNKEYISGIELYVNDARDGLFVNMTSIKRPPELTMLSYEIIAASMGEYIVKTGLKYVMRLCDVYLPMYQFIGNQLKKLGYTPEDCPPSPNTYGNENWIFDRENFPDTFRPNQYVTVLKMFSESTTLLECRLYFRVN